MAAKKFNEVKAGEPTKTVKEKKMYKIKLPISQDNQDDVWVCINGKGTLIQRGIEVEVSEAVYKVLKNQEEMTTLAFMRSKELADKNLFS